MSFQNWHKKFDEFWLEHWKVSKVCTLMDCFWPKYIIFQIKEYRGVIFHDTREWCKIWRKTDSSFQKWHEKFGRFSPQHSKVPKFWLWWVLFIQSKKIYELKIFRELCALTIKNDAKFEVELTCQLKSDMRYLTNFEQSTQKSKKSVLQRSVFYQSI